MEPELKVTTLCTWCAPQLHNFLSILCKWRGPHVHIKCILCILKFSLHSSDGGHLPGSTTWSIVIVESTRVHYLTSSDDVEPPGPTTWHLMMHQDPLPVFYWQMRPSGSTTWPLVTMEMHQDPLPVLKRQQRHTGSTTWSLVTVKTHLDILVDL